MKFQVFENQPFGEKCYVIVDDFCECVIVDPGGSFDEIGDFIDRQKLKPQAVLLTHAHCDHIVEAGRLASQYELDVFMSGEDRQILESAHLYWRILGAEQPFHPPSWDQIKPYQTDRLTISNFTLSVHPTPGHTPGSCILGWENLLLTGDTIFRDTLGRTDLVGGNRAVLERTIRNLPAFSHSHEFLPGHGPTFSLRGLLTSNDRYLEIRENADPTY